MNVGYTWQIIKRHGKSLTDAFFKVSLDASEGSSGFFPRIKQILINFKIRF